MRECYWMFWMFMVTSFKKFSFPKAFTTTPEFLLRFSSFYDWFGTATSQTWLHAECSDQLAKKCVSARNSIMFRVSYLKLFYFLFFLWSWRVMKIHMQRLSGLPFPHVRSIQRCGELRGEERENVKSITPCWKFLTWQKFLLSSERYGCFQK